DRLPPARGSLRDRVRFLDARRRLARARDRGADALLAARGVVLTRELPRGLDGLRAPGDEEQAVQPLRREGRDAGGELDRAGVRVAPVRVEGQLAHLCRRGLADLLAVAVAYVHREEAGECVEVSLAVRVLEVAAVAAHDDRHLVVAIAGHAR